MFCLAVSCSCNSSVGAHLLYVDGAPCPPCAKGVFVAEEFVSKAEGGAGGESGAGMWCQPVKAVLCAMQKKTAIGICHEMYLVRLLPYCACGRAVGLLWALSYLLSDFLLSRIASLIS